VGLFDRLFGKTKRDNPADASWQVPLVQQVCIAMIRSIPDEWDTVYLVLEPTEKGIGTGLSHSAITRTLAADFKLHDTDFVTPNMDVLAATRQLELGFVSRNWTFKRAIISAKQDSEGGWDIRSDYEHDE